MSNGFQVVVEGKKRRYNANQNQHNKPYAFLTIVGTVEKAYQCTGHNQNKANPEGGGLRL